MEFDAFDLIKLKDQVVTDLHMPQNPDARVLRGKTGSIYGNLFSRQFKGLPLSYFKDLKMKKILLDLLIKLKYVCKL